MEAELKGSELEFLCYKESEKALKTGGEESLGAMQNLDQLILDIQNDAQLLSVLQVQKYPTLSIKVRDTRLIDFKGSELVSLTQSQSFSARLSTRAFEILAAIFRRKNLDARECFKDLKVYKMEDLNIRFDKKCSRCGKPTQKALGFYVCYETSEYFCGPCQIAVHEEIIEKISRKEPTKHFRMLQILPNTTPEMLRGVEVGALRLTRELSSEEFERLTRAHQSIFLCRYCQGETYQDSKAIQYVCMVCPLLFCHKCSVDKIQRKTKQVTATQKISHQYVNKQRFGHLSSHPCSLYYGHVLYDYVLSDY